MEITMSNWLQLIITLCTFAAGFGALRQKIEFQSESMRLLRVQIDKLQEKQDKHNDFMRRMASVENAVNTNTSNCSGISSRLLGLEKEIVKIEANVKSNQHRIDDLER